MQDHRYRHLPKQGLSLGWVSAEFAACLTMPHG
jgi:hypothetical protein